MKITPKVEVTLMTLCHRVAWTAEIELIWNREQGVETYQVMQWNNDQARRLLKQLRGLQHSEGINKHMQLLPQEPSKRSRLR